MARCDWCGAPVTDRFYEMYQDRNGNLLACPDCAANSGLVPTSRARSVENAPVQDDAEAPEL